MNAKLKPWAAARSGAFHESRLSRGANHVSRRRLLQAGLVALAAPGWAPAWAAAAFDLQGHRGARGLAPENTLAGFRAALRTGVTTLELDVVVSADGMPVVAHDLRANANFTRNAQGQWLEGPGPAFNSLSLADIRRLDVGRLRPGTPYAQTFSQQQPVDGEAVPTLAEVFAALRQWGAKDVRLNIETKLNPREAALSPNPAAFARAVLREIDAAGLAARCTVQSFDWRTLQELRALQPALALSALSVQGPNSNNIDGDAPGLWTGGLRSSDFGGSVPRMVKALGAVAWSPQFQGLTPALVQEAQALGLKVLPWTVNEPAAMERLIDWAVDGLITDYPDRARTVMAARGMVLPMALKI